MMDDERGRPNVAHVVSVRVALYGVSGNDINPGIIQECSCGNYARRLAGDELRMDMLNIYATAHLTEAIRVV